ncbi:MAG: 50S ribosomal protein L1 [Bacteroidetes bacterium]|jgi:large subunit ribosomal protein L1|nr:MAG: 50S ribosomal protein L1 [Bacteroidota bacterium]PTM20320.1 MAG: 50S ribosomal protein L1 [Bacteroidota bacterium]
MAKRGKKYQAAAKLVEPGMEYTIEEACELVRKTKVANFDESVDLDLKLGVDPRHADQMVRGTVSLPHGTGKDVRVLALVNEGKQQEAKDAGADHVGLDDYIEKIEGGWVDVDIIIATPDVMGKIGRLGRQLGPRGLMPNPKSGTVTMDVGNAVREFKSGKMDFRVDKAGIVHTTIGKSSFEASLIQENLISFLKTIISLKPASAKGLYIRSATLSTTMGPGIPISRSSITSM